MSEDLFEIYIILKVEGAPLGQHDSERGDKVVIGPDSAENACLIIESVPRYMAELTRVNLFLKCSRPE